MPLITRLFLKTGLTFLLGALILGIALQLDLWTRTSIVPLFWHMLMVGWITQIIMGVSLWMFPGRNKVESFKNQQWAWFAYLLLVTGLLLRIISEPMIMYSVHSVWKILLVIAAIVQFLAILSYTIEIWPRVTNRTLLKKSNKKEE